MEKLIRAVVEEIAFEGPNGISWASLVSSLSDRNFGLGNGVDISTALESVRDDLLQQNQLVKGRGDVVQLFDQRVRYQLLGVSTLPTVFESPQSLKLLELIARGRERGAWSFALCSFLKVDAKQLFHLTNVLVDFGLVYRLSNLAIPRSARTPTGSSKTLSGNATFFIHSRYGSSPTDPYLQELIDPEMVLESVGSLILTLLREAGGVMSGRSLYSAVVQQGRFSNRQFRKGKIKLISAEKIEAVKMVSGDAEGANDSPHDSSEDEPNEVDKTQGTIMGYALVEQKIEKIDNRTLPMSLSPEEVKTEDVIMEEEETPVGGKVGGIVFSSSRILARNILRANMGYRESVLAIIGNSGLAGVTTKDISEMTGVSVKELGKLLETLKSESVPLFESVWRNTGRTKYIVYRPVCPLEISLDEGGLGASEALPPVLPSVRSNVSSKGYVTASTLRRATYVKEILSSRKAMSLTDLGRAMEALEHSLGVGVSGSTIDRRTLKKVCELSNFPTVEKFSSSFGSSPSPTNKVIIVFDPDLVTAEEALAMVIRPVGIVGGVKQQDGGLLDSGGVSGGVRVKAEVKPEPVRVIPNLRQVLAKGRLAALSVLGNASLKSVTLSPEIATMYGYVPKQILRSKILHLWLLERETDMFSPSDIADHLPLMTYLQIIGCGRSVKFVDDFLTSSSEEGGNVVVGQLPVEVRSQLAQSAPFGGEIAQIAKLVSNILEKLFLVERISSSDQLPLYEVKRRVLIESVSTGFELPNASSGVEYWNTLYRKCVVESGDMPSTRTAFPKLFQSRQWKTRVVVSLSQRRKLEQFLTQISSSRKQPSSQPVLIDGSNESLVSLCSYIRLEVSVALKALEQLNKREYVVIVPLLQARFACHLCSRIFFQRCSVQNHYQLVHNADLPPDPKDYTTKEYLTEMEKLVERSRGTGGGLLSKRRRRKSRREGKLSKSRRHDVFAQKILSALRLAKRWGEGLLSTAALWLLVEQIIGPEIFENPQLRSAAIHVQRRGEETKSMPSEPAIYTLWANLSVAFLKLLNLVTFHDCLESDLPSIEKLFFKADLTSELSQTLHQLHRDGRWLVKQKNLPIGGPPTLTAYALSKTTKQIVFGRYAEIDKFVDCVESALELRRNNDISVCEEFADCMNYAVIDALSDLELSLNYSVNPLSEELLRLELLPADSSDPADYSDEDEDFEGNGIQKHLDDTANVFGLIRGVRGFNLGMGDIHTISQEPKSVQFFKLLAQNSKCELSHLWRLPSSKEDSQKDFTFEETTTFQSFPTLSQLINLVGGNEGRRMSLDKLKDILQLKKLEETLLLDVDQEYPSENDLICSKFLAMVFEASPEFFLSYSKMANTTQIQTEYVQAFGGGPLPTTPPKIRLATWVNLYGEIDQHILADLLLHAATVVHNNPGITIRRLKHVMAILPESETETLLWILHAVGIVDQSRGEWFANPVSKWS